MKELICRTEAVRILKDLIRIPTVNPMGEPYKGPDSVERKALEYIAEIFRPYGVEICQQACSPIHENLLITVPGESETPHLLLESHVDTVPAGDWPDRAFEPRIEGDLVFGRGACDDKGPLVAMILALRAVLESGQRPPRPVIFLAAGDEEYAQTGIKYFSGLNLTVGRSVIGEPTHLVPIIQHKGTVRWDIRVQGKSAHSSRPELGTDAILGAMDVIRKIAQYQGELRKKEISPLMTGPTLTVTLIQGGRTRNAVADECKLAIDFRVLPGMDPAQSRQNLIEALSDDRVQISHDDIQLLTPPLNTRSSDPFSLRVLEICRTLTGQPQMQFAGAPYGTDAAWVADKGPAIVLGPGTVDSAHAIDENIDIREVVDCAQIYWNILMDEV